MAGRLSAIARNLLTVTPAIGLAPRPGARPLGVSALVRVKDEEEWIEPSLRSLEGFADEIIVVDNGSTDSTVERVRELQRKLSLELRLDLAPGLDHTALSNHILGLARFRWVIRWDADCVAHTSGPHAVSQLRGPPRGGPSLAPRLRPPSRR